MSRIGTFLTTVETLTATSIEEASRHGRTEAGIEDLLVALSLDPSQAGQTMRNLGLDAKTLHQAVAKVQAEQLASLGIDYDTTPGEIAAIGADRASLSAAANKILQSAGAGKADGSATAVLRALVNEPSGQIAAVLAQAGSSPAAVTEALGEAPATKAEALPAPRGTLVSKTEQYVPAPVADVWALLADPSRTPEWDEMV